MRRLLMVACLFTFVLSIASAYAAPAAFPTRNNRTDVVIAYAQLTMASGSARRELFLQSSPSMQGDLWILHLEYFVTDHEQLTTEQRSIIFEAVGLLASGLFEEDHANATFKEHFE